MQVSPTGIPEQRGVSEKAQSLSPIDLARDSFDEVAPSVTPSVKKGAKKRDSNIVISENNGSDEEIVYVARRQKKSRKSVPLPASSSQSSEEVQVIEQVVTVDLQVDSDDLPKTGHFGDYAAAEEEAASIGSETVLGSSSSNKSVDLLAGDDSDEV